MRQISVDDGLSQGFVYDGLQDKEGFMWFATMDGLNRYDGYGFKVYKNDPENKYSLPENSIYSLAEDDKGNLWIGTLRKGLYVMDKRRERFYKVPVNSPLLPDEHYNVRRLACVDDRLYVSTTQGMIILNTAALEKQVLNEQIVKKQIPVLQSIPMGESSDAMQKQVTSSHSFFNSCENNKLILDLFTPDKTRTSWTKHTFTGKDFGFASIELHDRFVLLDSINSLLIIHERYVYLYNISSKQRITLTKTDITVPDGISLINNKLYVCGRNSLYAKPILFELDLDSYQSRLIVPTNEGRILQAMFQDRTGTIWFRTDTEGLFLLNKRLRAFKNESNNFGRFVLGTDKMIVNDKKGNLLEFSTVTRTFKRLADQKDFNRISNTFNYSFEFRDHTGHIWKQFKSDTGKILLEYDPSTKQFNIHDWGFDSHELVFEDRTNKLWIVHMSADRLTCFLSSTDKQHNSIEQTYRFPASPIYRDSRFLAAHYQDARSVFWLATDVGLFAFDPTQTNKEKNWKQWKNIPGDNSSLSADNLISLCPDPQQPQKYLWLGTRGSGLNRFDITTGTCIRFTEKDGLANNVVYCIIPDELGHLWISTNMGLSCFSLPGKSNPKGSFRNFTEEDGICGNEFNTFAGKKIATGELFFQGVKGTTWFKPAEVLQLQPPVPIQFISLAVNNKTLQWENDSSVINGNISYCREVTLSHDQNIFSLSFSSMDFRNQKGKLYSYYLQGFEKSWTEPTSQHTVTYTNLNPGTYTFHVKGTNSDGVWNEKGSSIKIIILPAWYQTWWFRALLALVIAGGLYGLYRFRVGQLLKMATLRNRIASDLHDEIGSTLSSISLYGESAKKMMPDNEAAGKVLTKINDSTAEMMEAMSDIVWAVNTHNDRFDNL
ncbi:MAG TPA: two-component regulator propeller domain-containing protein, partial [Ferruginibacter sp.]|nr:two-component regulator propeller domain-containing protein [Ferruginibacter sp.]